MAQEALVWEQSRPSPCEKRDAKVVRLLRSGGHAWGVTEARSAFVYPRSLQPLRKIAEEVNPGATVEVDGDKDGPGEEPAGLAVSQLLEEAFPVEMGGGRGGRGARNEAKVAGGNSGGAASSIGTLHDNEPSSRPSSDDRRGTNGPQPTKGGARGNKRGKGRNRKADSKPVFHAYGNGNTSPPAGGVVYGGYMLSHAISPQVLPNKPHTRQVHSGTQRVAARVAARAKTEANTASIRDTGGANVGANDGGRTTSSGGLPSRVWNNSRRFDERQPSRKTRGTIDETISGLVEEARPTGHDAGRATDSALTRFNALPEDDSGILWGLAQTRRASLPRSRTAANHGASRRSSVSKVTNPPPRPSSKSRPDAPSRQTGEECTGDEQAVGKSTADRLGGEEEGGQLRSAGAPPPAPPPPPPPPKSPSRTLPPRPPHAWTADQRLANDPRNYKFLPRGWAAELITPAGISGPDPSRQALFTMRGGSVRKSKGPGSIIRSSSRAGVDECGVRDCLRWNPPS